MHRLDARAACRKRHYTSCRDIELLLMKALAEAISVIAVGDPRQATYVTNNSSKNKGVSRSHITTWLAEKEKEGLIRIEERKESWRSNQAICDFADALYACAVQCRIRGLAAIPNNLHRLMNQKIF